ncbi:MAG: hypothetical protein ACRBHB_01325 [Arenicella sp.]
MSDKTKLRIPPMPFTGERLRQQQSWIRVMQEGQLTSKSNDIHQAEIAERVQHTVLKETSSPSGKG